MSDIIGVGKKRVSQQKKPRAIAARNELVNAYQSTFSLNRSDAQMVLVHLAEIAGWNTIPEEDLSGDKRAFRDGKRAIFIQILNMLNLTDEEKSLLFKAARAEYIYSLADNSSL